MSGDTLGTVAFIMLALVLPVAALRHRDLAAGQLVKWALVWGAIIVAVAVVFSGLRL